MRSVIDCVCFPGPTCTQAHVEGMSGWQRAVSRSTGVPYYFNSALKKSFYSEKGLPDGWVFEWKDTKNNIKRYFNVYTNEKADSVQAIKELAQRKAQGQPAASARSAPAARGGPPQAPTSIPGAPIQATEATKPGDKVQDELAASVKVLPYPAARPQHRAYVLGWFYESHKYIFDQLLSKTNVRCIVELGAFYGKSTQRLAELAPRAQVFAVDLWSSSYLLQNHRNQYDKNELVNVSRHSLKDCFLQNTWGCRERLNKGMKGDDCVSGVTAIQGDTCDSMKFLHAAGVVPDVIFVDADREYERVRQDLDTIIDLWGVPLDPDTGEMKYTIVGAGFEHKGTKRAVKEVSMKYGMPVYLDSNQVWTYTPIHKRKVLKIQLLKDVEQDYIKKQFKNLQKLASAQNGSAEMFKYSLRQGGTCYGARNHLEHFDENHKSLLMYAAENGNADIVRVLIDHYNANPSAANIKKGTPLHSAAYNGHFRVVELLLEYGANKHAENSWGEAPHHSALSKGHTSLSDYILSYAPPKNDKVSHQKKVTQALLEKKKRKRKR